MFVYCVVCRCVYGTRPWAIGIVMDTDMDCTPYTIHTIDYTLYTIDKPDSTGLDETRVD